MSQLPPGFQNALKNHIFAATTGHFNIFAQIRKMIIEREHKQFFRASVTSVSGNKVKIKRYGQTNADGQFYATLESYTSHSIGEEVFCCSFGGSVLVMGRILR